MSRPPLVDALLALLGAALTGLLLVADMDRGVTWDGTLYVLIHLGLSITLALRSTWRRGSFVLTYALLALMAVVVALAPTNLGVSPLILCAPLALYKVARHDPPAWGVVGLLLGIAGVFVSPLHRMPGGTSGVVLAVMILGMVGTYLWAAGRRRTEVAYDERMEQARLEHAAEAQRLVTRAHLAERTRIAREVHDIVAHSLAVVSVQAKTALAVGTEEQMRTGLLAVRDASTEALTELRALVSVLRDDDGQRQVSGEVSRLLSVATDARAAGVDLADTLDEADLARWQDTWSAPARLAVLRVVQEALTNVIKHGGPSPRAHLVVREEDAGCLIEVTNDARHPETSPTSGFGLAGLRERVALSAGTFEAGPHGDGFRLTARIPTGEETR